MWKFRQVMWLLSGLSWQRVNWSWPEWLPVGLRRHKPLGGFFYSLNFSREGDFQNCRGIFKNARFSTLPVTDIRADSHWARSRIQYTTLAEVAHGSHQSWDICQYIAYVVRGCATYVVVQLTLLCNRWNYGRSWQGRWKPTSYSWLATSIYRCSRFWVNLEKAEICENQWGTLGKFSDFPLNLNKFPKGPPWFSDFNFL